MILRAAAVWLLLLMTAVAAGAARVGLLEPLVGERTAHQLGTLAVVVLFAAAIWTASRDWPSSGGDTLSGRSYRFNGSGGA